MARPVVGDTSHRQREVGATVGVDNVISHAKVEYTSGMKYGRLAFLRESFKDHQMSFFCEWISVNPKILDDSYWPSVSLCECSRSFLTNYHCIWCKNKCSVGSAKTSVVLETSQHFMS